MISKQNLPKRGKRGRPPKPCTDLPTPSLQRKYTSDCINHCAYEDGARNINIHIQDSFIRI
jgi:hypothetical protein